MINKFLSCLFAVVLIMQICSVPALAENSTLYLKQDNVISQSTSESISYNEYLEKYESYGANTIDISIKDIIKFDNALIQEDSVRFEKDGSNVTFNVSVQEAGLYNIQLE